MVVFCWLLISKVVEDDIDDVEAAQWAYSNGGIPLSELERRMDVALDPEAQQLRELVEDVQGVGPETSALLAGGIYEYRRARGSFACRSRTSVWRGTEHGSRYSPTIQLRPTTWKIHGNHRWRHEKRSRN